MQSLQLDPGDRGLRLPLGLSPTDLYLPTIWLGLAVAVLLGAGLLRGGGLAGKLLGLGAVSLVIYLVAARLPAHWRLVARGWALVPALGFGHDLVGHVIRILERPLYDSLLIRMDLALLGGHASQWAEAVAWPPFIELLQIGYTLYFIVALPLVHVLARQRRLQDLNRYVSATTVGLCTVLVLYVLIPARTPYTLWRTLGEQAPVVFSAPLKGLWLTGPLRAWFDSITTNIWDAFPSGHTTMALLAGAGALRYHRRVFWLILPVVVTILLSTVMLRYHYVVDVLAAAVLVALVLGVEEAVHQAKRRVGGGKGVQESSGAA